LNRFNVNVEPAGAPNPARIRKFGASRASMSAQKGGAKCPKTPEAQRLAGSSRARTRTGIGLQRSLKRVRGPFPKQGRNRKEAPMTEWKKRILKTLIRLGLYVASQVLGKPYSEQLSSTTVTETRKTQKTQRTKQRP